MRITNIESRCVADMADMVDNLQWRFPTGKKLILQGWVKTTDCHPCLVEALKLIAAGYESHAAAYLRMTYLKEE